VIVVGVLGAAWAVLTGILILVGEGVKHSSALNSLDRHITDFVVDHRTPALNQLMKAVTWTGSWIATLGIAVLVAVFAWRRRLHLLAVIAVLAAWLGELLAVTLTKAVVERPRPPEAVRLVAGHGWAFPSGHTANATVVFATSAALATVLLGQRYSRLLVWALAALATALVGFSRIELGVHWTTDVVASVVWTVCWLFILVTVLRRSSSRELVAQRQVSP
jgi:undecaprenyl-diphosphatase